MITHVDLFGKDHIILSCVQEDIDKHFEKIHDVIPQVEVNEFKARMLSCVKAGSAYTLEDGSCFLYYLSKTDRLASGVALFGKHNPIKMWALFAGVFMKKDTHTIKLNFNLHAGKFIQEYKSIITLSSIKRQRILGYPAVVRVDVLRDKMMAVYSKRKK